MAALHTTAGGTAAHISSQPQPSLPDLLQAMCDEMLHFQTVLPWRCLKPEFADERPGWRDRAWAIATYADFAKSYKSLAKVLVSAAGASIAHAGPAHCGTHIHC